MTDIKITRRTFVGGVAGAASLATFGARAQGSSQLPTSPVALSIVDVAGNLALTQKAIENYRDRPSRSWSRASPSPRRRRPSCRARSRRSRTPNRVDIDLRADRHRRALGRHRPEALDPAAAATTPRSCRSSTTSILPGAKKMQALAAGPGRRASRYYPSGPLLEYMPDKVKKVPTTAEELLAWAKAEPEPLPLCAPGQFRPRPHLHDGPALHPRRQGSEGSDEGLGQDLGLSQGARREHRVLPDRHRRDDEGARRRHARHDRLARRAGTSTRASLGIVPKEAKVGTLKGFHWVTDAHYMCVPKGVPNEKLAVLLDLMNFLLTHGAAGLHLRRGLFLSGPGGEGRAARRWRRRRARRRSRSSAARNTRS